MLPELASSGFDAVQIGPAQESPDSPGWYHRYQPKNYGVISGLGTEADLRALCATAQRHGIMIIADLVFNHMLVVAQRAEWAEATDAADAGDPAALEALQQRLESQVGPAFDRWDFQWPWFAMDGAAWDDDRRYEGWGNGEWSELRWSSKVVFAHTEHMRALHECGVRGFRVDAAKHMRPQHVATYVQYAHALDPPAWTYLEVLNADESNPGQYEEYIQAAQCPVTDFWLPMFLSNHAAAARGSKGAEWGDWRNHSLPGDHVCFARNHDTAFNPGNCGIAYGAKGRKHTWSLPEGSPEEAAWALILATARTVLVFGPDWEQSTSVREMVALRGSRGVADDVARAGCALVARWAPSDNQPPALVLVNPCPKSVTVPAFRELGIARRVQAGAWGVLVAPDGVLKQAGGCAAL